MPDMWIDVDTAVTLPVNKAPLIDDTDFKTREVSIAYNATGMDLVWNFETSAGATSQTAVTPTTGGGDYDWTHSGGGMYKIGIPASGGASINNDTEGYGWFSGICDGVLAWISPVYGFRAAGLNDAMCDSAYSTTRGLSGTALPNAAADAAGGLPISDAGGLDLDAQVGTKVSAIHAKLPSKSYLTGSANSDGDIQLDEATGGPVAANMTQISGDGTAADNFETMLDGTGGQTLTLGQLRINANNANGAVDIDNSAGAGIDVRATGGNSAIVSIGSGTGHGASFVGGSTNGAGLRAAGGGGTGHGIWLVRGSSSADDLYLENNDSVLNANQTTILNRLGSITGTGMNTVLGFFQSLMRSDVTVSSDIGGTYDDATDSLQAIRDRGDAAWTTGSGGDATEAKQDTILAKLLAYFQLALRKDAAIATDNATELTALNADGGSGAGSYDNTSDSDEAIADAVALLSGSTGSGADNVTVNIKVAGVNVADADVWITSDSAGANVVAGTLQTDSNGNATFLLDAGNTYYLFAQKDGMNPIIGQSFVAVAD